MFAAVVACAAFVAADASGDVGSVSVTTTQTSITVSGTEFSGEGQCGQVGVDLFDSEGVYTGMFQAADIVSDPQDFSFTFDGLEPNTHYFVGVWDLCEAGDVDNCNPAHAYYACPDVTTEDEAPPPEPGAAPSAPPRSADRFGFCSAPGDTRPDGTPIAPGTFLNLLLGQPETDRHYTGAVPAFYVQGVGITCSLTPQQAALAASSTQKAGGGGDVTPYGIYPYIPQ